MYNELLKKSSAAAGNVICMGLDPVEKFMPADIQAMGAAGFPVFFEVLFRELQHRNLIPAAFKPNQGFYLIHDEPFSGRFEGSIALAKTIELIRAYFPGTPVIMDYKRGDIAGSSANYAGEGFDLWKCDAVTVSPYMGHDSVSPFLEYGRKGKGTYVLNRTSNPGASDLQSLPLDKGSGLFKEVADLIVAWNSKYPGTGAVAGATSTDELRILAETYSSHDVPLLIPGVGKQGGSAADVCRILKDSGYDLSLARINSSSGLTHPWAGKGVAVPEHWQEVCADEVSRLVETCTPFM